MSFVNGILSQLQFKIGKWCVHFLEKLCACVCAHTHNFLGTDKPKSYTMSYLKIYVPDLKIFQKYPKLEVIEYDQNVSFCKTCLGMIFARISLFSSIIYYFKFYTCTVPDTWYTASKYKLPQHPEEAMLVL